MSEDNAQHEPTMEEILASIRRIISEDNEDASSATADVKASAPAAPVEEDASSDEMDDLHAMIDDAVSSAVADAMEEEEVSEVDDVEPFVDVLSDEEEEAPVASYGKPVATSVHELKVEESSVESVKFAKAEEKDLMSDSAAGAVGASFQNLARSMPVLEEDGRSLEGIVVEMLRPVLASWLDQHLPKIVENLVQKEIERVSRRDA